MNLRLIDAHCHVNFNAYKEKTEAVISRSLEKGIGMIAVGTQKDTSQKAIDVAKSHDGVWAIIGLHPIHLFETHVDEEESSFWTREEKFDVDRYRQMALNAQGKVIGFGECGLDYFHRPDNVSSEEFVGRQVKCFEAQLDLAEELDLPIMIHCRDAHTDIIKILEMRKSAGHSLKGDVHCFTGDWDQAQAYLNLGLYLSFTGIITFPPRKSDLAAGIISSQELAKRVPLDRILVETDAPYLTPVPHRGEWPNEPAYVEHVAAELAKIRGVSTEEMERITLENTVRLFGL